MYRKFLAKMFPFGLYVLLYIMVVRISVDFITKKMFLIDAVFMLICCCCILSLCQTESKYVEPFIWFAPTELIFTQRLVLKQRHKDTFIHELLTGAFDSWLRIGRCCLIRTSRSWITLVAFSAFKNCSWKSWKFLFLLRRQSQFNCLRDFNSQFIFIFLYIKYKAP